MDYSFSVTAQNGKPDQEVVRTLVRNTRLVSRMGRGDSRLLTIAPYVEQAAPYATNPIVIRAAAYLKDRGFSLALDQPLGILLLDPPALLKVLTRFPQIEKLAEDLHFYFDDLCEALVREGNLVANVYIHVKALEKLPSEDQEELMQLGMGFIDYYEVFRKRWWHWPRKRWWERVKHV